MKALKIFLIAAALFSCGRSEQKTNSPEQDTYGGSGKDEYNVRHTGNAAVQDEDSASTPKHEAGLNSDMDANEANDSMGGTPSGRGTIKTGIARDSIAESRTQSRGIVVDSAKRR